MNRDQPCFGEVGHEDADDAERDGQQCGDLRDRLDLPAQQADPLVLRKLAAHPVGVGGRTDQRFDGQFVAGTFDGLGRSLSRDPR